MQAYKETEKRQRVEIFELISTIVNNEEEVIKHYPYSSKLSGGLRASVRSQTATERFSSGMAQDSITIQVVINYRPNIVTNMYLVFNTSWYRIISVDPLDFKKKELKLIAQSIDPLIFDREEYDS